MYQKVGGRVGRPRCEPTTSIGARVPLDVRNKLNVLAEFEGISRSQLLIKIILEYSAKINPDELKAKRKAELEMKITELEQKIAEIEGL